MSGKCRPSLRPKTLENVRRSDLSKTDKECIMAVFKKFEKMVEVVRCKDCKFAHGIDSTEPMYACINPEIYGIGSRGEIVCHSMHFCSYGERKDGADNE